MKRKTKIISIILTFFILLSIIPIPLGVHKDGGTREYFALCYKIVSWSKFVDSGERYDNISVYPFPLNFCGYERLWEIECEK